MTNEEARAWGTLIGLALTAIGSLVVALRVEKVHVLVNSKMSEALATIAEHASTIVAQAKMIATLTGKPTDDVAANVAVGVAEAAKGAAAPEVPKV